MKIDLAKRLMQYQKEGYTIKVNTYRTYHIGGTGLRRDGPVHHIYEKDGDIVFDSDIHTGASLSEINPVYVGVSKPVAGWYA